MGQGGAGGGGGVGGRGGDRAAGFGGGGRGGGGGGQGERGGANRFWERKAGKCVKCAYRRRNSPPAASTPLRAGSASSMKNPPPLRPARVFWGLKGGKREVSPPTHPTRL